MSWAADCECCGQEGTQFGATYEEPGEFSCANCEEGTCARCFLLNELASLLNAPAMTDNVRVQDALRKFIKELQV